MLVVNGQHHLMLGSHLCNELYSASGTAHLQKSNASIDCNVSLMPNHFGAKLVWHVVCIEIPLVEIVMGIVTGHQYCCAGR